MSDIRFEVINGYEDENEKSNDVVMKQDTQPTIKNDSYSIGDVLNGITQLVDAIRYTNAQVEATNKGLEIVTTKVNGIEDKLNTTDDRLYNLEVNDEIKDEQVENIKLVAKLRVYNILGLSEFEHSKYYRTFIGHAYTDAKLYAGLGSKITRTKRGNYQRIVDYLEAWIPKGGCAKLKADIDKKANAKLLAQKSGY